MAQRMKIDGELKTVKSVNNYGYLPMVEFDDGTEYYVAEDSDSAGEAARKYWEEMAQNDPKEFACLIGTETLVQWGMGHYAGPGSTQVKSLEDWLDLWLNTPEEQWASYDGSECSVDRFGTVVNDLDFHPTVAYRHN